MDRTPILIIPPHSKFFNVFFELSTADNTLLIEDHSFTNKLSNCVLSVCNYYLQHNKINPIINSIVFKSEINLLQKNNEIN